MKDKMQKEKVRITFTEASRLLGTGGKSFYPKTIWQKLGWEHKVKPDIVPFNELTLATNGSPRILVPCPGTTLGEVIKALKKTGVTVTVNAAPPCQTFIMNQKTTPIGWITVPMTYCHPDKVGLFRSGEILQGSLKLADAIFLLGIHLMTNEEIKLPKDGELLWYEACHTSETSFPDGFFVSVNTLKREIIVHAGNPKGICHVADKRRTMLAYFTKP